MSQSSNWIEELRTQPAAEVRRRVQAEALATLAGFLGYDSPDEIDPETTFLDLGFDSLRAVDFKDELAQGFGCELRTTLVFDHPTPSAVTAHLIETLGLPAEAAAADAEAGAGDDLDALDADALRARLRAIEDREHEPIAIVGLACRFPGKADTPERYWRLMRDGVDAVTEVPADRFPVDRYYDPDHQAQGKIATRYGAFVDELDRFDARFFGMSAREAIELDPRQRILLETVWECLEHGAQAPQSLRGRSIGMYLGILNNEYFDSQTDRDEQQLGQYNATGCALSTAAGRVSYTLGWVGPSIALDTACSSSLVAVHLAVQSLRRGECEMAVASGVNALIDPLSFMGISQANMLAADGRCKTFDAKGDGYVRAEGCGAVLLKPLSKAQADGDRVFAVIRGTASNQDGASSGLTVPNGPSQVDVVRTALADARVHPREISYVEAHGTGTSLGDPIEIGALDEVFGPTHRGRGLPVGSVKTNIGHLEPAAGIAGLLKIVLALQHEEIPPNLHFETPNPHVPWDESVVQVPTEARPWPRGATPRLAGISSFGFSGTNAHVILSEAPAQEAPAKHGRAPYVLPLSAQTEPALMTLVERYRDALSAGVDPADVVATAAVGRAHHSERLALVADGFEDLKRQLKDVLRDPAEGIRGSASAQAPEVAFLFTGQGSQLAGMARELYDVDPVFRGTLDRCAELLAEHLDRPLFDVIWAEDSQLLDQTEYTQPALFAIEYSLAEMWRAWGVEPTRLLGHSVGEYVAACVAGVFSLADGLRLIAARGRLMKELCPPGAMLAVFGPENEVLPYLAGYEDRVGLAAANGPANTVLAGEPAAIAELAAKLSADKLSSQELSVSRAFHSPLMEPMLAAFEEIARGIELRAPEIPIVSCLDARVAGDEMATADFWVRHVQSPVRFQAAMEALAGEGCEVMLEVGPQPVLLGMARRFVRAGRDSKLAWVPSLRRGQGDWAALASSLAELYVLGVPLDWRTVYAGNTRPLVDLPTYPFQRERYWYERVPSSRRGGDGGRYHPLLGQRLRSAVLGEGQVLFESVLSSRAPAFLAEHVVFGGPIVPGAGLLEMALSAGTRELLGGVPAPGGYDVQLEGVAVQEALPVDGEETTVQLVLSPSNDGAREFKIFSLRDRGEVDELDDAPWTLHVSGHVRATDTPAADAPTLAELEAGEWTEITPDQLYAAFDASGLEYGPLFRGIRELRRRDDEALSRVRLAEALAGSDDFRIHPALLDACFQTAAAALVGTEIEDLFLPIGMETVRLLGPVGDEALCHMRVREGSTSERSIRLDVHLYSERAGGALTPVLVVEGLQLVRADAASLSRADEAARTLLHAVTWEKTPRGESDEPARSDRPTRFALAGSGALAGALRRELEGQGFPVAAEDPAALRDAAAWSRLLGEADVLVDLGALSSGSRPAADLCAHLLEASKALVLRAEGAPARLVLVTRGAQPAGGPVAPEQAALWGLANTLALEHPELEPMRIDLDPSRSDADAAAEAAQLVLELRSSGGEDQVALRTDERFAPRLARQQSLSAGELTPPGDAFEVRVADYGMLENLTLVPLKRRAPNAGEVEVELGATALNFKDVLYTLGMMKEWSESHGVMRSIDQPLGFEGAGTVVRIGEGVTDYAVGDRVVVKWIGAMATHVTAPVITVFHIPEKFTVAEAAGLPTVFQTALYSLEDLAHLKRGDRVLIHAAAGGVGQAAVQVARRAGAEIFATASPAKHAVLRREGVHHVLNSRTLDFADEILAATGGEGVDVVLNSLANEFVDASVRCLKKGGRFVEIGKIGVWSHERMATERPDAEYHFFDLSERIEENPDLLRKFQTDLAKGFADGSLTALPTKTFPVGRAVEAFSYMAQAKNVGKVVLTLPAGDAAARRVRGDRTYLVTGGLGALGMVVAEQLVDEGARHLVLCGRRGLDEAEEEIQSRVAALEERGATVLAAAVDVAARERLIALFDRIARDLPPLAGVVHAAGVLDDGMLMQLDGERIAGVLAPKVAGARNLDELTRNLALDFFVLFSSMTSALGAQGQAAYAAGNAYMDALAHRRAAEGLPALSINWGPWSGGGMAASLASRNQVRFAEMGLKSISPDDGAALFGRLLAEDRPQVLVLPIQWSKYLRQFHRGGPPALYSAFASAAAPASDERSALLDQLAAATPPDRTQLLGDFLERQLTRVLGFGASTRIDPHRNFGDLGVDSLLAVDLRNRLEGSLDVSLPATLLFDYPNLEALVGYLQEQVLTDLPGSAPAPAAEEAAPAEDAAAELAELTEDEVARRLAAEIDALSAE
ncbi:MAG: SDR family NAD(P)-dependent oxidoreductase [Planctomycetota bacterium]